MSIEIRPITEGERVDWIRAEEAAFGLTPKQDEIDAMLPVIETDRSLAALEDGRIVGASGAVTLRMWPPSSTRRRIAGSRSRRCSRPRAGSTAGSATGSRRCSASSRRRSLGWNTCAATSPARTSSCSRGTRPCRRSTGSTKRRSDQGGWSGARGCGTTSSRPSARTRIGPGSTRSIGTSEGSRMPTRSTGPRRTGRARCPRGRSR
jgi:hypothetical protein